MDKSRRSFERRVDIVKLYKLLQFWGVLLVLMMAAQTSLNTYFHYSDRRILETTVQFEKGQITEEIKLLQQEREHLSIATEVLDQIKQERFYDKFTASICDYLASRGRVRRFSEVKSLVMCIDEAVPRWFPNKEFVPEDFYALAQVESEFKLSAIGKKGERGAFQILDYRAALKRLTNPNANPFDAATNVEMACLILKQKHRVRKTYKDSIIAYNGYVKDSKGKVKEQYWRRFRAAKSTIKKLRKKALTI